MPGYVAIAEYLTAISVGQMLEFGRRKYPSVECSAHDVVYHALLQSPVILVLAHQLQTIVLQAAFTLKVLGSV